MPRGCVARAGRVGIIEARRQEQHPACKILSLLAGSKLAGSALGVQQEGGQGAQPRLRQRDARLDGPPIGRDVALIHAQAAAAALQCAAAHVTDQLVSMGVCVMGE